MLRLKSSNALPPMVYAEIKKRRQSELPATHNTNEPTAKKSIGDITGQMKMFVINSPKSDRRLKGDEKKTKESIVIDVRFPAFEFDQEMEFDMLSVGEYASGIFLYHKSRETKFRVLKYMEKHPDLSIQVRAIIVEWTMELQYSLEFTNETLFTAVKAIDMFLSVAENFLKENLQTLVLAAVQLAMKFEERENVVSIDDLRDLVEDGVSYQELVSMERQLFKAIDFDLGAPLSYRFLRRLARLAHISMEVLTLARYILEITLLVYDYSMISGTRMAAVCFFLAMKMRSSSFTWTDELTNYSGYTADEVTPLVEYVNHTLHFVKNKWSSINLVREKYSKEHFFRVALLPLLPDSMPEKKDNELPELPFLGKSTLSPIVPYIPKRIPPLIPTKITRLYD